MAEESGGDDGWWGSWGAEFLSTVKAKSAETLTLVKHDLSEFVTTIQHDTSATIAETASTVKEQLKADEEEDDGSTTTAIKHGVSNWLGSLSSALKENISHMAAVIDEEPTTSGSGQVFDRTQARRHEIQTDPATYCNDPDGHPAHFEEWCKSFELDEHKGEISELLVNRPEVRSLYTKLVPAAVHHSLFWHRYFYKIHQLDQEDKRRAALVERANKMQVDELGWDDEEDAWGNEEVSKEELEIPAKDKDNDDSKDITAAPVEIVATETEDAASDPSEDPEKVTHLVEGILDDQNVEESPDDAHHCDDLADVISDIQISRSDPDVTPVASPTETETEPDSTAVNENVSKASKEEDNKGEVESPKSLHENEASHPIDIPVLVEEITEEKEIESTEKEIKRENSTNGSIDSSWSKISEEELKTTPGDDKDQQQTKTVTKGAPSPSPSGRSSSSAVLVPAAPDDEDLAWDDDLDFGDDDVTDDVKANAVALEDDDDWEKWE